MSKNFIVGCVIGFVVVCLTILSIEVGDTLQVVDKKGRVCGCMYDSSGFKECRAGLEYIVITTSKCK